VERSPVELVGCSLRCCFANEAFSRGLEKQLGIAFNTANKAIRVLQDKGIVKQLGNSKRDRVYRAEAILTILEEPAKLVP